MKRAPVLFCIFSLFIVATTSPEMVVAQDALPRVVAVHTAKVIELDNGSMVRLAAIQAPNRARDDTETDDPLAQQAYATMQRLALGHAVRLEPIGDKPDRRGRVVAMAYVDDIWLQEAMLREGMAWVYTFADTRMFAEPLLAAEHEAEQARRGVWGQAEYAVLSPQLTAQHIGEFRLVQGTVQEVAEVHGRYYINFGEDWKTDFTLQIDKADAQLFATDWLEALSGKTVRVRGWLFEKNGPAIALSHPEQVEIQHEKLAADPHAAGVVMHD
jgi:endonuclease YncB( thermonuclease family)